jgi:hypothetical protein
LRVTSLDLFNKKYEQEEAVGFFIIKPVYLLKPANSNLNAIKCMNRRRIYTESKKLEVNIMKRKERMKNHKHNRAKAGSIRLCTQNIYKHFRSIRHCVSDFSRQNDERGCVKDF